MKTPNIFKYATSELSQDAFLCWLIACADSEDTSLKNLGLDFIAFLYNSENDGKPKVRRDRVQGLAKCEGRGPYPWKQYYKIDVYFQAIIDGEIVSFIIEDKVGSAQHSDQLKRYAKLVENDKINEKEVRRIYFKTGYIYPDEEEKTKIVDEEDKCYKYNIISLDDVVNFLKDKKKIDSDILKNYFDYVLDMQTEREYVLNKWPSLYYSKDRNWYDGHYRIFQHQYAQFKFMLSVKEKLNCVIDKARSGSGKDYEIYEPTRDLCRGKNRGGDPWTQFGWASVKRKYKNPDIEEYIFWRIDGWQPFRLRLGCWPDKDIRYDGFAEDRKNRIHWYRAIFEEEGRKIFGEALNRPPRRMWRSNVNESTLGDIYFNSPENTVEKILEKLPEFQRNFMNRIFSDKNLNRIL